MEDGALILDTAHVELTGLDQPVNNVCSYACHIVQPQLSNPAYYYSCM